MEKRRTRRGGRGSSSGTVDTSYQGKTYNIATGRGLTADKMFSRVSDLSESVRNDVNAQETIKQLKSVQNNPNAKITIYRATVGNSINKNDWIFLSEKQAEKWTKTPFGTPKKGVKVLKKKVLAKKVDWSGKNLEFVYLG